MTFGRTEDLAAPYYVCENCAHTYAAPEPPSTCENCGAYWLLTFDSLDAAEERSQAILDARD